jgi:hypothetical protein
LLACRNEGERPFLRAVGTTDFQPFSLGPRPTSLLPLDLTSNRPGTNTIRFVVDRSPNHLEPASLEWHATEEVAACCATRLSAYGIDAEGRNYYGAVSFQIGLSKLAVTLAPPPSNPALVVSNIHVRVSVMGTAVALSRVSDANGHLEVDALPDATVALDAMTIAAGIYYYGAAVVTLCADRSVTLFMLNVKDVVHGVSALTIDPGSPPCPPASRR